LPVVWQTQISGRFVYSVALPGGSVWRRDAGMTNTVALTPEVPRSESERSFLAWAGKADHEYCVIDARQGMTSEERANVERLLRAIVGAETCFVTALDYNVFEGWACGELAHGAAMTEMEAACVLAEHSFQAWDESDLIEVTLGDRRYAVHVEGNPRWVEATVRGVAQVVRPA
jgi:hypothetical protein